MLYYTNAASETVVRHIVGNACKKNRDPHREIPTPYLSKALRKP